MAETKQAPSSDSEAAVLSVLLSLPHHARDIFGVLSAESFARPDYRAIFATAHDLYQLGVTPNVDEVTPALGRAGLLEQVGGKAALTDLSGNPQMGWAGHASEVNRYAGLRRVQYAAYEALDSAKKLGADPGAIAESLVADASAAARSAGIVPTGELFTIADFVNKPGTARSEWVIPGLLRRSWRAMLVAGEGIGKMVLFRQLAIAAAQGIHPLAFTPIPPIRTLLVDLENPDEAITETAVRMDRQAQSRAAGYDPERSHLWHREQGVDLRSRPGRDSFEAVLAATRPDAVFLGPVYKAFRYGGKDREEDAVTELMQILDDLRVRYGFALMLEHHAPKASGGERRSLNPFGTSLWLRWCELGLTLRASDKDRDVLTFGRFRRDRSPCAWPVKLERSGGWPFVATWPDGTFAQDGQEEAPF